MNEPRVYVGDLDIIKICAIIAIERKYGVVAIDSDGYASSRSVFETDVHTECHSSGIVINDEFFSGLEMEKIRAKYPMSKEHILEWILNLERIIGNHKNQIAELAKSMESAPEKPRRLP